MAKKRKMKDEQERAFKIPEFDREEYVRKEISDGKITIATILYAGVIGMFSYVLSLYGGAFVSVGVLVGLGGAFTLRRFHALAGFPVDELDTKHIVGYALLFLLTWLAIWIVVTNPPASDISSPIIEEIEVREEVNGTWQRAEPVRADVPLRVYALVYDYGDLSGVKLEVSRGEQVETFDMTEDPDDDNWFYADVTFSAGSYRLVVTAEDTMGNTGEMT